jgi:uncharacterized NAD(P)/FAD-binding protein YdhS
MGEYLKTRFQEAAQLAQDIGLAIRLYPASEVVDLRRNGGKICLIIKDLLSENDFSSDADRVLLATGHWIGKNNQDGYFTSPWPAKKLLRKIPKGAKVAVIGTSLSAIETLLTLTSEGEFKKRCLPLCHQCPRPGKIPGVKSFGIGKEFIEVRNRSNRGNTAG